MQHSGSSGIRNRSHTTIIVGIELPICSVKIGKSAHPGMKPGWRKNQDIMRNANKHKTLTSTGLKVDRKLYKLFVLSKLISTGSSTSWCLLNYKMGMNSITNFIFPSFLYSSFIQASMCVSTPALLKMVWFTHGSLFHGKNGKKCFSLIQKSFLSL